MKGNTLSGHLGMGVIIICILFPHGTAAQSYHQSKVDFEGVHPDRGDTISKTSIGTTRIMRQRSWSQRTVWEINLAASKAHAVAETRAGPPDSPGPWTRFHTMEWSWRVPQPCRVGEELTLQGKAQLSVEPGVRTLGVYNGMDFRVEPSRVFEVIQELPEGASNPLATGRGRISAGKCKAGESASDAGSIRVRVAGIGEEPWKLKLKLDGISDSSITVVYHYAPGPSGGGTGPGSGGGTAGSGGSAPDSDGVGPATDRGGTGTDEGAPGSSDSENDGVVMPGDRGGESGPDGSSGEGGTGPGAGAGSGGIDEAVPNDQPPWNPAGVDTSGPGMWLIAEKRRVPAGQIVVMPVWLINGRGLVDMNFNLTYDSRLVQTTGDVARGNLLGGADFEANPNEPGKVQLGFVPPAGGINYDRGTIVEIAFRAVGRPGDRARLTLVPRKSTLGGGAAASVSTVDGEILIVGAGDRLPGDSNGNNSLDMDDVLRALKMSVGLIPVDLVADMDGDRRVSAADARLIRERVLGRN
jgi:hypothetical protein